MIDDDDIKIIADIEQAIEKTQRSFRVKLRAYEILLSLLNLSSKPSLMFIQGEENKAFLEQKLHILLDPNQLDLQIIPLYQQIIEELRTVRDGLDFNWKDLRIKLAHKKTYITTLSRNIVKRLSPLSSGLQNIHEIVGNLFKDLEIPSFNSAQDEDLCYTLKLQKKTQTTIPKTIMKTILHEGQELNDSIFIKLTLQYKTTGYHPPPYLVLKAFFDKDEQGEVKIGSFSLYSIQDKLERGFRTHCFYKPSEQSVHLIRDRIKRFILEEKSLDAGHSCLRKHSPH